MPEITASDIAKTLANIEQAFVSLQTRKEERRTAECYEDEASKEVIKLQKIYDKQIAAFKTRYDKSGTGWNKDINQVDNAKV